MAGRFEPVEERHGSVEDDDVGPERLRGLEQSPAVGHGPDDIESGFQDLGEGLPEEPVIIREQDTRALHRSLTSGVGDTVIVPSTTGGR